MPIYEYKCDYCQHGFEKLGSMSAYKEPAECPKCGGQSHLQVSVNSKQAGNWAASNIAVNPQRTCKTRK